MRLIKKSIGIEKYVYICIRKIDDEYSRTMRKAGSPIQHSNT